MYKHISHLFKMCVKKNFFSQKESKLNTWCTRSFHRGLNTLNTPTSWQCFSQSKLYLCNAFPCIINVKIKTESWHRRSLGNMSHINLSMPDSNSYLNGVREKNKPLYCTVGGGWLCFVIDRCHGGGVTSSWGWTVWRCRCGTLVRAVQPSTKILSVHSCIRHAVRF